MGLNAKDIIELAVAVLIGAVTLPIGISQIYNANTTGWNSAVTTVFTVLFPLLAVLAIVLYLIRKD